MTKHFPFEHKHQPLLPFSLFLKRMVTSTIWCLTLISITVGVGTISYHGLENQTWIDALLNSVCIMSGLGLNNELTMTSGKLFTILYALFSAIVFYSTLAILFTPVFHRFLHHFHLEKDNTE